MSGVEGGWGETGRGVEGVGGLSTASLGEAGAEVERGLKDGLDG